MRGTPGTRRAPTRFRHTCELLLDAAQQLGRLDPEPPGEPDDCVETWTPLAALQFADFGSIQVAEVSECLLAQTDALPVLAEILGELLLGAIHTAHAQAAGQRASTDKTSLREKPPVSR